MVLTVTSSTEAASFGGTHRTSGQSAALKGTSRHYQSRPTRRKLAGVKKFVTRWWWAVLVLAVWGLIVGYRAWKGQIGLTQ